MTQFAPAPEPLTDAEIEAASKRLLMACRRVTWQRIFFGVALAYCRIRLGNVGTACVNKRGDMWFCLLYTSPSPRDRS